MYSNDGYTSENMYLKREALVHNYGRVPEVEVDRFFQSALPFVEPSLVDKVINHLVDNGLLVLGDKPTWASFPERPSDCDAPENEVFTGFLKVYEDTITSYKYMDPNREQTVGLFHRPATDITSSGPNSSRPEGYFIPIGNCHGRPDWKDIVMACEYKKLTRVEDKSDSAEKLIWNMHHMMRNDFRRFAYGLTIEDFTVRVWLCDRSENMVSQPFELDKEPRLLVRLFLALSFATRSELGFDPTIEHLADDKIRFSVHSKRDGTRKVTTYIADVTKDIIAESGADAMNGWVTRVLRVHDEKNPEEFYVLKDVWVSSGRALEGDFLRDFRKDIEKGGHPEDLALFEELFMTVVADGVVMIDSDKEDRTLELIRRGIRPRDSDSVTFYAPWHAAEAAKSIPRQRKIPIPRSNSIQNNNQKITYCPRVHYRIVFKELGQPLHALTDMRAFMGCLPKVVDGIELLHKYQRLHRDISTGNVIILTDEAGGASLVKLSDLEYGRKGTEGGHDDVRTGPYEFMAVEVCKQRYLFLEPYSGGHGETSTQSSSQGVRPPKPFRHNVLHELESVWWIALWYFLREDKLVSVGHCSECSAKLKVHRAKLFGASSTADRLLIILDESILEEVFALLPENPAITDLARRFTSYVPLIHCFYSNLENRWNDRDRLFSLGIQKFRQFILDLVKDASVLD